MSEPKFTFTVRVLKEHINIHAYVWAGLLFAAFVTLQKEVINLLGATLEDILTIAMVLQ